MRSWDFQERLSREHRFKQRCTLTPLDPNSMSFTDMFSYDQLDVIDLRMNESNQQVLKAAYEYVFFKNIWTRWMVQIHKKIRTMSN
jgi:hypothetical protein